MIFGGDNDVGISIISYHKFSPKMWIGDMKNGGLKFIRVITRFFIMPFSQKLFFCPLNLR